MTIEYYGDERCYFKLSDILVELREIKMLLHELSIRDLPIRLLVEKAKTTPPRNTEGT